MEQKSQEAAAKELHCALSQFFGAAEPLDQSTPKLGATSLKEDRSWGDLESQVSSLRSIWSPGKAPPLPAPSAIDRTSRSPLRHSTVRHRPSVNFGARRDPVGSIGELVAKAARDRSARSASLLCRKVHHMCGVLQTVPEPMVCVSMQM